jgi:putative transposase
MPSALQTQYLEPAYQLHHYLIFRTHYLREMFQGQQENDLIDRTIQAVCEREQFHMLDRQIAINHVRLLVSLTPDQTVSQAVQRFKGNISRQFSLVFPNRLEQDRMPTLWARGYFARSSGKVDEETIRSYIDSQIAHHGYRGSWTEALRLRNPAFRSPAFSLGHCFTILQYHLVLETDFHIPVFDDAIASKLFQYVIAIGEKHGFAVDRMSVLPNHVHLLVEAVPSLSAASLANAVISNTQYWMEKNFWGVLKQTRAWDVWKPSYYVGTTGEFTTAEVRSFLSGAYSSG